jgi:hypothetical protein
VSIGARCDNSTPRSETEHGVPSRDCQMVEKVLTTVFIAFLSSVGTPGGLQRSQPKLMIFGDENHKTYLGCLNCPESAIDSIFNKSCQYGNCRSVFSDDNLFCRGPFREFGSSGPFHDFSACSDSASNPPVIVDGEGHYYGRFSIGGVFAHADAVCSTSPFSRFKNKDACEIVKWVCEQSER